MLSPKLKGHFKTFIRLWNKRKLPPKYYRTCSIDFKAADCTLDLDIETVEESATPRYPLLEDTIVMSPIFTAQSMDLSPGNTLGDKECEKMGAIIAADSPFSTFGKASEADGVALTSPAMQPNEVCHLAFIKDPLSFFFNLFLVQLFSLSFSPFTC